MLQPTLTEKGQNATAKRYTICKNSSVNIYQVLNKRNNDKVRKIGTKNIFTTFISNIFSNFILLHILCLDFFIHKHNGQIKHIPFNVDVCNDLVPLLNEIINEICSTLGKIEKENSQ